jgi:hypothetical protein
MSVSYDISDLYREVLGKKREIQAIGWQVAQNPIYEGFTFLITHNTGYGIMECGRKYIGFRIRFDENITEPELVEALIECGRWQKASF